MITMIAAIEEKGILGDKSGKLPWAGTMPEDAQHWRQYVKGKRVIVGSATFKVLGKLDPSVSYVVLTHSPHSIDVDSFDPVHVLPVGSIDEALGALIDRDESVVIGGATTYSQFLPFADRLVLTNIAMRADMTSPVYFPEVNPDKWNQITKEELLADTANSYDSIRLCLERKI